MSAEELPGRISKEYINSLPIIKYEGQIRVIQRADELSDFIDNLPAGSVAGFDTETRPSFKSGESHSVALVQIALPDIVLLVQVQKVGLPVPLIKFFENPAIQKVGIGIKDDINKLTQIAAFTPAGFVDLSCIAEKKGIVQTGVRGLAARYLNGRISKSAQTSNWEKKNLTGKQQLYAATDAWACLMIYPLLLGDARDYHPLPEEAVNPLAVQQ